MRFVAGAAACAGALLCVAPATAAVPPGDGHGQVLPRRGEATPSWVLEHGTPAAEAPAAPPISWGVADDFSKFADDGGAWFYRQLAGASLTENRWTLAWDPSHPTAIEEIAFLQRAAPLAQAAGIHVVLALYAGNPSPIATSHDPAAFCAWAAVVADMVERWGIHDYIVWNEPNTALYWAPQKDASGRDVAAAPYEELLARCYDSIHAADANANVIGMGLSPRASTERSSNDPLSFLRDVGAAYRASGRTAPIMDQLALHPYPRPDVKGSPPDAGWGTRGHAADRFAISQLDRVKQAVYDAFAGTPQPTTLDGLTFRLDEVGWQTDTSAYPQYFNPENWRQVVTEQQQAAYLRRTITHYFACDPTVTDVELFLLVDEPSRNGRSRDGGSVVGGGWQSGLMTARGPDVSQPKPAYAASAPLFAAGRSACTAGTIWWTPGAAGSSGTTGQGDAGAGGKPGEATRAAKRKAAIERCSTKLRGQKNEAKRATCIARAKKTFGG